MNAAVVFAVLLPGLLVAHNVADHWCQTHHQAGNKGLPGWPGRIACARHVATYTLTTAVTVALLWWVLDLRISLLGFGVGQMVSAVTHYIADRRAPIEWLVQRWPFRQMGKDRFYRLGAQRDVRAVATAFLPGTTEVRTTPVELIDANGRVVKWDNPSLGTGAYALDQSWHWAWLFAAALITAVI